MVLFPCCGGLNGHSVKPPAGPPNALGLQYWVPGPGGAALSSDLTSLSLLIRPGVQELLLRVIYTEQGKDEGD